MKTVDKQFIIETLTFFKDLNQEQQKLLLENISSFNYGKGDVILSPMYECIGVLMVKSGQLRVYIISEDGREITLYKLEAGDACVLSAACLLQSISFDVYIESVEDTEVYLLNISTFSRLIRENVVVENFSLKNVVSKFSDIMAGMEKIIFSSIESRLRDFLLIELESSSDKSIRFTHEEIASYIGSAREVVSRTLKSFANKGLIEQKRGQIKIINKKALENIL